jgi:serine/threonine-protein kinase HipA
MSRRAIVFMHGALAGYMHEVETGYSFQYDKYYLESKTAMAVSQTLPLSKEVYLSNILFPFFDGLIPEGWLLDIAQKNWKLNQRDRMGLLLACCKDCIGAVSVLEENE